MDFHPGLDPSRGEDDVLRVLDGLRDPVSGLFQKRLDRDAFGGASVIAAEVLKNEDFQFPALLRLVTSA